MMDFKKEIKLAFSENKMAIMISIAIFVIFLLIGFFLSNQLHDILNPVVDELYNKVQTGEIQVNFQSIFANNIRVVFLSFLFGALFCFSALILAYNGLFIGYFTAMQDDFFNTILLLVPHGIFEIPSCIISCASGFVLFTFIYRFLKTYLRQDCGVYESYVQNFDRLKQAILLLLVASVLMIVAGIIETYLTTAIADYITSALS